MESSFTINKIDEIMNTAMKNIKSIVDVNTVIGSPYVNSDGSVIIPISKVTIGFLTGGGEYGEPDFKKINEYPFAGGSGAAVSLNPVGFLVGSGTDMKIINIDKEDNLDKLIDGAAGLISKFTDKKEFQ